jgi:hypothetical protein
MCAHAVDPRLRRGDLQQRGMDEVDAHGTELGRQPLACRGDAVIVRVDVAVGQGDFDVPVLFDPRAKLVEIDILGAKRERRRRRHGESEGHRRFHEAAPRASSARLGR